MKGEIITGNELASGATIYLTESGEWVQDIDRARVFAKEEAALRDEWLAKARANHRILSLEIEVAERDGDKVIAERLRERIRAEGPTAPRMEIQALGEENNVSV